MEKFLSQYYPFPSLQFYITSFLTQYGYSILENPEITWNFIFVMEDPGMKPW